MLIYILKFSACLAVFMVFYRLVLERSSMHTFKRFYLLGAILVSLVIPKLSIIEYIEVQSYETFQMIDMPIDYSVVETIPQETNINYTQLLLWSIYGLGVLLCAIKFFRNLYRIITDINSNPKVRSGNFINVLIDHLKTPHTFFHYIFINQYKFENGEIPEEVLLHEQTHACQKHSLDVMCIEILQIIFWFNPLLYILKRDIKLNHEFLADQAVLKKGIQPSTYQTILLAFSSKAQHHDLANAINYSSTWHAVGVLKKRFTVMKTHTPKRSIWLRSLLLLPVLAVLFYSFAERSILEIPIIDTNEIELYLNEQHQLLLEDEVITLEDIKIMYKKNPKLKVSVKLFPDADPEISQKLLEDLRKTGIKKMMVCSSRIGEFQQTPTSTATESDLKTHYNNVEFQILDANQKLISTKRFSELSSEEKALLPPVNVPSKRSPQPSDLERWKDAKTYGIWYDGNRIENNTLDSFSASDFSLFYESKLEKNAINYGKHFYQISLYSEAYYNDHYKNGVKPLSSSTKIAIKQRTFQQIATPKQMAAYNALAKSYNDQNNNNRTVKRNDVERLYELYGKLSDAQKTDAEPFPNFPPPPEAPSTPHSEEKETSLIPPPPPPIPVDASPEHQKEMQAEIERYEKTYKRKVRTMQVDDTGERLNLIVNDEVYEPSSYNSDTVKTGFVKINGIPHYSVSINNNTRYYNREGFEVNKNGQLVSKSQVSASQVVPGQYITKVFSDSKIVTEFKDDQPHRKNTVIDVPLPPKSIEPVAPISALDLVNELAKKDATFYNEGREITSSKAIKLIEKNSDLNVFVKHSKTKNPKIFITKDTFIPKQSNSISKPTSANIISHIKVMNRHHARFFLGETEITYKEALSFVRKHKNAKVISSMEHNTTVISLPKGTKN
ncbi:MAG: M56 family metallopeptidase [Psychroserpens sp.]|uniref:M56 family metallopeptidase n=1 Tax=Psychroserpens sp. TaxID=2020870 RepID=UPI003CBFE911